tara:strand:+ start:272 stop:1900 length:1629 start_codon:yes stop_codon:yes gene_type:complete
MSKENGSLMGYVVGGSVDKGIDIRLDSSSPVEDIRLGSYVTIQGRSQRFFGMITGINLETTDPSLRSTPPDPSDELVNSVISSTSAYTIVTVTPELVIGGDPLAIIDGPQSARTIPPHFSPAFQASSEDIRTVFGTEDDRRIWVGNPLDMQDTRIHLDLGELVKRSNGVFGKSGTGKSFLTRILLAGILQKQAAVNLVFDMHSEYGWQGSNEGNTAVKGLKQLFPSKVAVFSLDPKSSRRRGISPDVGVEIGYKDIEPEDIEMLAEALNITPQGVTAVYDVVKHFGQDSWLKEFLDLDRDGLDNISRAISQNFQVLFTLHRRLRILKRMGFISATTNDDAVQRILEYIDKEMHVVLEFGSYGNQIAAYVLVANLLTRRIHEKYVELTEKAMGNQSIEPKPLVITVEEAHRFLTPGIASQTIFGTIAREMRKYKVTLLIVDQRPSGIDDEILSQLGTRFTYPLDNERDIDSVLAGARDARKLKAVLSTLGSQQQALIFGHSIPMPVVIRTRDYGTEESYQYFGDVSSSKSIEELEQDKRDLFG